MCERKFMLPVFIELLVTNWKLSTLTNLLPHSEKVLRRLRESQ